MYWNSALRTDADGVLTLTVKLPSDPAELRAHPLRIGLSAYVIVDVENQNGPPLATAPTAYSAFADVGNDGVATADGLIRQILVANAGTPP